MKFENFFRKYNGKTLEDWGAEMSPEAKQFYKNWRTILKQEFTQRGIYLVDFTIGHYYCSGFLEKNGKYVYFSQSIPRGLPLDLNAGNTWYGILYRKAKNTSDYTGGTNLYTNFHNFVEDVEKILKY